MTGPFHAQQEAVLVTAPTLGQRKYKMLERGGKKAISCRAEIFYSSHGGEELIQEVTAVTHRRVAGS